MSDARNTPDPEMAWKAVLDRDPRLDGLVFYGVITTGIYCRPTCPARRPLRSNVQFFADAQAAEGAGFRACLRCHPRASRPELARDLAESVRTFLDANVDETVTLTRLSRELGRSPWYIQRVFKKSFGQSPKEYVNSRRLEKLKRSLRREPDVTTAMYEAGFTTSSQLYGQAKATLGMTPGTWRDGGEGATLGYVIVGSPLGGLILVAATDVGLCSVLLGDDEEELITSLGRELPRARLIPAGSELDSLVEEVVARVAGELPNTRIHVDTPGTEFQRRIWQALVDIPHGETRSYSQIAAGIELPKGARAVARACAANRVAVVIPCHRVVKVSGSLGGYRWREERKRALLENEKRDE